MFFIYRIMSSDSHDCLPGCSRLLLCTQLPWQRFALQSLSRGFQISGSFNGIITNAAATDYSITFPLKLFLHLPPNRFASSACVADLWYSNSDYVVSSHTIFITSKVPFRTENIILQNRPFQISKLPLAQTCTVHSLAKIGQVKCAACA